MRAVPFLVFALGTSGCIAAYTWEDFTKGNDLSRPDAGGSDGGNASGSSSSSSSSSSGNTPDASIDSGTPAICTPGSKVFGTVAFEASPAAGGGVVCNPSAILAEDGAVAGLDVVNGGGSGQIDGEGETGCIGIDFGAALSLSEIHIVTAPSPNACGGTVCNADSCNTGHSLDVFVGADREHLHLANGYDNVDANTTLVVTPAMFGSTPLRVIAVCREAWGSGRDDMNVDVVYGVCN